jgi:hypothetical protein
MMDENDLVELARMGIEAEDFCRTSLGKFILGKADGEIQEATADLVSADPEDIKLNRELRNKIHVARMFKVWLGEAISVGRVAHDQLDEQESGF